MEHGSLEHRREAVVESARLVALAFRMRDQKALSGALRMNARAVRCLETAEQAAPEYLSDDEALRLLADGGQVVTAVE